MIEISVAIKGLIQRIRFYLSKMYSLIAKSPGLKTFRFFITQISFWCLIRISIIPFKKRRVVLINELFSMLGSLARVDGIMSEQEGIEIDNLASILCAPFLKFQRDALQAAR